MPQDSAHSAKGFDYTVRRSTRRRTLAVIVDRGRVIVRAPARLSLRKIEDFVEKEGAWILRKLGESRKRLSEAPAYNFTEGERLPYIGYMYPLRFKSGERTGAELTECEITVTLRPGTPEDRVPEIIRRWYIDRAREVFDMRAAYYSGELGIETPKVWVRNQKRRWGSCTAGDRINLNWRLITAPVGILDYVVAHELCHIIHRDHSRHFWNLLSSLIPEYRDCRKWLRENGHILGI